MIPRIIHHVWPSETQPFDDERLMAFRQSWLDGLPDWKFEFWRIANLPLKDMDKQAKEIILSPEFTLVVKSAVVRWELLRLFGGLYVDTDMELLQPLGRILELDTVLFEMTSTLVWSAILGFQPKDKLAKECSRMVVESILSNPYEANVSPMKRTTEGLTGALLHSSDRPVQPFELCATPATGVYPSALLMHHRSGNWPGGWERVQRFS